MNLEVSPKPIPCPGADYCMAHFDQWQTLWDDERKGYCCSRAYQKPYCGDRFVFFLRVSPSFTGSSLLSKTTNCYFLDPLNHCNYLCVIFEEELILMISFFDLGKSSLRRYGFVSSLCAKKRILLEQHLRNPYTLSRCCPVNQNVESLLIMSAA